MKIYNILLTFLFALSFYIWIYDTFLYERTYVQYLPNYKEEIAFQTFSSHTIEDRSEEKWDESVPAFGMILFKLFPIAFFIVYLMFIPTFIYGIILFITKKMQQHYKWWITQLIVYGIIVFFIFNTQIMD